MKTNKNIFYFVFSTEDYDCYENAVRGLKIWASAKDAGVYDSSGHFIGPVISARRGYAAQWKGDGNDTPLRSYVVEWISAN